MSDILSSQIYLSRDSIREQISNEIKEYLELENVDLTKSSFLSFLVDTISTFNWKLIILSTISLSRIFSYKGSIARVDFKSFPFFRI